MIFSKEELIKATGAKILKNGEGNFNLSTDTRTINDGDIYLPLKGETFDGENFINDAIQRGAKAYFTTRDEVIDGADLVLKVKNTTEAYMGIAKYYKEKVNPISIAVTGSSGKTTTKEMVYSVVSEKFKSHKTFSNHNNEIGFCQTLLNMPSDTEVLVVEMGMRGLKEIEPLSRHLNPDFAIITNCGSAHVGRLGNLDNIAKAKCEITAGLKSGGIFIAKNQDITKKHLNFVGEKIFYSLDNTKLIEIASSYTKFEYKGSIYELFVEGEYNVENALAAIEVGLKLGMTSDEIALGLAKYRPVGQRWAIEEINGLKFINDSYNANPDSMKVSVKTFIDFYPNPVAVLGNMGELGENEVLYHRQVGEFLATLNKNVKYILIGNLAKEIGKPLLDAGFIVKYFDTNEEAARYIIEKLDKSNTIFLKASRSMKFEQILENIKGI